VVLILFVPPNYAFVLQVISSLQVFYRIEDLKVRNNLEDLGLNGGIILKWVLKKWVGWAWT